GPRPPGGRHQHGERRARGPGPLEPPPPRPRDRWGEGPGLGPHPGSRVFRRAGERRVPALPPGGARSRLARPGDGKGDDRPADARLAPGLRRLAAAQEAAEDLVEREAGEETEQTT